MNKVLYSIDRWGPAVTSVITLFVMAIFGWLIFAKIARLEGLVSSQQHQLDSYVERESAMRGDNARLYAWSAALYEQAKQCGMTIDPPPKQQFDKVDKVDKVDKNKKKGD